MARVVLRGNDYQNILSSQSLSSKNLEGSLFQQYLPGEKPAYVHGIIKASERIDGVLNYESEPHIVAGFMSPEKLLRQIVLRYKWSVSSGRVEDEVLDFFAAAGIKISDFGTGSFPDKKSGSSGYMAIYDA